jgi:hypothetical protein
MSQREGDMVFSAGIGEPVPAVHAFAGDEDSLSEGLDGFAEGLGVGGEVACVANLSGVVEDDEEEGSGVEINAGVESGVGGRLEVAHEDLVVSVRRRKRLSAVSFKSASRAFMSIQRLKLTGAAILVR